MKKCVIIGSGLGGLTCGCIMAQNNYDVTVLEQSPQVGGCLQCFKRGDAVFNTGMHYIGSADDGQILNTILRYLGVDSGIPLSRLDTSGYDVVSFGGEHYNFANGRENFIDSLVQHFPESKEELNRYFDIVQQVASSSAIHSLNRNADINVNAKYQIKSVNEVIESVVHNPLLQKVLTGNLPLYAGERDKTPFSTHALISDCYNQSAYRIVGGSNKVAEALATALRNYGGRVLTNSKVSQIECESGQARAVITDQGHRFPADIVISGIHPVSTVQLIDRKLIKYPLKQRLRNAHNTVSAFTVYLKFRENAVRYMNHNLYIYRGDNTWNCEQYDLETWPKFILYMHFCDSPDQEFARTGEIITYMKYDEVKQWVDTSRGKRGDEYEEFKRMKAEIIIDALEKEVPGIRNCIERYYTASPLTYNDYTGTPEGSMYGLAKDITAPGKGYISCRTSIPNLLLTGQSITCNGMLGVMAGGLVTCSYALTSELIFQQLNQYK